MIVALSKLITIIGALAAFLALLWIGFNLVFKAISKLFNIGLGKPALDNIVYVRPIDQYDAIVAKIEAETKKRKRLFGIVLPILITVMIIFLLFSLSSLSQVIHNILSF